MSGPHVDRDVAEAGIKWFSGWGPARVLGACEHDCDHTWGTQTLAWGPDQDHYELIRCNNPATCAGLCRGWTAEYQDGRHSTYRTHGWKRVAP